ncbi:hypothetical protein [Streptomyces sp. NPDC091879]|uniref:hypothetical protein n=1 Tax=Streptomyces sp. NPDC091879 TaxID=3366006 RepID=UPI0037F1B148
MAASFHGIYSDSQLGDAELLEYAFKAYVKDNWVSWEQNVNQNAGGPRYNEAAQAYNAARQEVDADIAAANEQVLADAAVAFPGF